MTEPAGAWSIARNNACSRFAGLGGLSTRVSLACCKRRRDSRCAVTLNDWIGRRRFQQRVSGTTSEKSEARLGIEPSSCSVRLNQSAESSMLAVPAEVFLSECVERPEPNSKAMEPGGRRAATSSKNRQLRGGRIQAGISSVDRAAPLYSSTRRSSWFSSVAFAGARLDSAITFQNSFHHFDPRLQSRLVFPQSNHGEPPQLVTMPNE